MTHELANELKAAGFPQTRRDSGPVYIHIVAKRIHDQAKDVWYSRPDFWKIVYSRNPSDSFQKNEWALCPTLSELIEACGEEFGALSTSRIIQSILPEHQDKLGKIYEWKASRHDPDKRWECGEPSCCPGCGGEGSTPEEAVARLWLAIKNTK